MKCPHCDYEDGWSGEQLKRVKGEKGQFWKHPVHMQRERPLGQSRMYTELYACPSCGKTFIEV